MKCQVSVMVAVALVGLTSGCRKGTVESTSMEELEATACTSCPMDKGADDACGSCPEAKEKEAGGCGEGGVCDSVGGTCGPTPAGTNVVVTVEGESLTEARVSEIVSRMMAAQGIPPQMAGQFMAQLGPRLREQAVEQFIDQALVLKEAKTRDYTVTDAEIEAALDSFRARLPEGMTLEQAVAAQGLSMDQLREDARSAEYTRKLFDAETADVVAADEAAIAAFYSENPQHFVTKEEAHARHILIGCDAEEGEDARVAAKAKAEELRSALLEGADFAEVARENSTCPSAQRGGDLGSFGRGAMVPAFDEVAFTEPTNAISEVVETQFGYHVVQVLERSEARTNSLDTVREDIGNYLTMQARNEKFQSFAKSLREGADIVYAE
jgi:peptidyl-prolyl cis-trans isomerase C